MSQRETLMRDLHRAGLRLDDAALAAAMVVRRMLDLRNGLMVRASETGMPLSEIAQLFGVSKTLAHKVVNSPKAPAWEAIELDDDGDASALLVQRLDALLVAFRPKAAVHPRGSQVNAQMQQGRATRQAGECRPCSAPARAR